MNGTEQVCEDSGCKQQAWVRYVHMFVLVVSMQELHIIVMFGSFYQRSIMKKKKKISIVGEE